MSTVVISLALPVKTVVLIKRKLVINKRHWTNANVGVFFLPTGSVGSPYPPFSPWLHSGLGVLDAGGSTLSFSHSRNGKGALSNLFPVQFFFQLLLSFL